MLLQSTAEKDVANQNSVGIFKTFTSFLIQAKVHKDFFRLNIKNQTPKKVHFHSQLHN